VPSPIPSNSLNSVLNGVAAVSSNDAWAVGSYFINQFDTNTLIEHWNGSRWSIVSSPSPGPTTLLRVAAVVSSTDIWAIGNNGLLPLVEHWNGAQWSVVSIPTPTAVASFSGIVAIASNDVWVVGRQTASSGSVLLTRMSSGLLRSSIAR
jgi:hypothetical protein